MKTDKKNVIINEIHYWKDNKLLPETYCDFLLALYTEGNQVEEDEKNTKKKRKSKRTKGIQTLLYIILLFVFAATLLVIYFTELSIVLQITLVAFLLLISLSVTAYFKRKSLLFQVPLSLTFVQLLIGSISLVEYLANGDRLWMGGTVVINCLLWIITGYVLRIKYLLISGSVGLFFFLLTVIV